MSGERFVILLPLHFLGQWRIEHNVVFRDPGDVLLLLKEFPQGFLRLLHCADLVLKVNFLVPLSFMRLVHGPDELLVNRNLLLPLLSNAKLLVVAGLQHGILLEP